MDLSSLLFAALVVLPAAAFATWTWLAMTQIEEDLRAFERDESRGLEI